MRTITYEIHLIEPVLFTSLDGDPNTAVTHPYLPGSALRGAIIGSYMRQNGLRELDGGDETTKRLFFNGQTRYLNAYLKDNLDQRSLPTPLSWQQDKACQRGESDDAPAPVYDFAVEEPEEEHDKAKQWKRAKKPFFSLNKSSDNARWLSPQKILTVHTQRDPGKGRATRARGEIYQYEALAAGQKFVGMILCEERDVATLTALLSGEYNIGGSRGAGYGRVRLQVVRSVSERAMLGELQLEQDGRFIVTCLSDMILQDAYGQFQADAELVKAALEKRLGCSLKWHAASGSTTFVASTYVGGFNRKWGLPLPQAKAIAMGSVFVFEPADCTLEQLQELETSGLGLRRAEGFGRIAFNWHDREQLSIEPSYAENLLPTVALSSDEEQLVQAMVNRLFRQRLDAQLGEKAQDLAKKLPVKNSQLSRLRSVVQDVLQQRPSEEEDAATIEEKIEDGRQRLIRYVESLQERSSTRKQFERAKINGESLLAWLTKHINDPSGIESELFLGNEPAIGAIKGSWTAVMRYEYNLRLIDTALAYCSKKGKEES